MDELLFDDSRLPDELDARVRAELRDGEKLLWVGQPNPKRMARAAWPVVLFGIPWTAFSLFWMAMAVGFQFIGNNQGNADGGFMRLFFPLFGLPFVLIGLGMLSAPYWLRRRAKKSCYALTSQRAILWNSGRFGGVEVRSFGPSELKKIRRVEFANGEGDLLFEETIPLPNGQHLNTLGVMQTGFIGIPRVRDIEELLRKALLTEAS